MEAGAAASSPGGLLAVGGGSGLEDLQEPPGSDPVATRQGRPVGLDRSRFCPLCGGLEPGSCNTSTVDLRLDLPSYGRVAGNLSLWSSHSTACCPSSRWQNFGATRRRVLLRRDDTAQPSTGDPVKAYTLNYSRIPFRI